MAGYVYETHTMRDPLLPFIFHRSLAVRQKHSLPNWHENIELLFCTGGKGYVQCGPDRYPFCAGDIFVVNADTPHCICSEGSVLYRCLIIDNGFCTANGIPIYSLYFQNCIRSESLNACFEKVTGAFEAFRETDGSYVPRIRCAVLELLCELCSSYIVDRPIVESAANTYVKTTITYVRQNLSQPISLEEIAGNVGISKFHLCREFKAFTGKTIVQTINLIRCNEAKRRMENGMTVSEAAQACGFENTSYFSRTFKKLFGMLPSACKSSEKLVPLVQKDEETC